MKKMLVDLQDLQDRLGMPQGFGGPNDEGRAPGRYTRTPVEHTYFEHAPPGTYTVYVSCYSWDEPDSNPLPYTIHVRSRGQVLTQGTGTIGPANYIDNDAPPIRGCQFIIR